MPTTKQKAKSKAVRSPRKNGRTSLQDFKPAALNANDHTEYGTGLLARALHEDGYVAPMTAAADGEIIDGSNRLETSADVFANVEPLVIHHKGDRPIIMVRDDIPNARTQEAQRIALRANRIAEVDLKWNSQVIAALNESMPDVTKAVFDLSSLTEILNQEQIDQVDYADFDQQLADLAGMEETMIAVAVPVAYAAQIIEWLANGEKKTSGGLGKGVMRRCGLL
jgi:hypothetical protein